MFGLRSGYRFARSGTHSRRQIGRALALPRRREDFAVVRALRAAGHDVLAVAEFQNRSVDEELMAFALGENRILITEDKDFGWLTFAAHRKSPGVILIRYPSSARSALGPAIAKLAEGFRRQVIRRVYRCATGLGEDFSLVIYSDR